MFDIGCGSAASGAFVVKNEPQLTTYLAIERLEQPEKLYTMEEAKRELGL